MVDRLASWEDITTFTSEEVHERTNRLLIKNDGGIFHQTHWSPPQ